MQQNKISSEKFAKMAQSLEKLPSKLEDEEEDEDDIEEYEEKITVDGGYDPKDYDNLEVTTDVKNVFSYITCYTPQNVDLEYKLKPFIPDFIPTVGDIDAFIKVMRPDGVDEGLGLKVLDEPSATKQSDASLLALRFRALTKEIPISEGSSFKVKVASDAKEINAWIDNIKKLHDETAGAPVQTSRLPDVEQLMQEWDPELEEILSTVQLPPPDISCDLNEYVNIICAILDIPVHGSKIASLHQLFSLYQEFRSSQHFKQLN